MTSSIVFSEQSSSIGAPNAAAAEIFGQRRRKSAARLKMRPSRWHEIQQFRCLSISPDNISTWWESQQQTYPSKLARVVLAIPATSAPSERIFSVAGLTVNARRSSLAPSSVDKVIFVHENALINEQHWHDSSRRTEFGTGTDLW